MGPGSVQRLWRAAQTAIGVVGEHVGARRLGNEAAPTSRTPAAMLTFAADGSVSGTEACNDTGGTVRWTERGFERTQEVGRETTAMGCGDEKAVAFGRRFWSLLRDATSWRREGERLSIQLRDDLEAELRFVL